MDSLAEESENSAVFGENECIKSISNTPKNISGYNNNIVYKLFNREVSYI